jgi:hypothetical protein
VSAARRESPEWQEIVAKASIQREAFGGDPLDPNTASKNIVGGYLSGRKGEAVEGRRFGSGDEWKTYANPVEAAQKLGIERAKCAISHCVLRLQLQTHGYEFRRKGEDGNHAVVVDEAKKEARKKQKREAESKRRAKNRAEKEGGGKQGKQGKKRKKVTKGAKGGKGGSGKQGKKGKTATKEAKGGGKTAKTAKAGKTAKTATAGKAGKAGNVGKTRAGEGLEKKSGKKTKVVALDGDDQDVVDMMQVNTVVAV